MVTQNGGTPPLGTFVVDVVTLAATSLTSCRVLTSCLGSESHTNTTKRHTFKPSHRLTSIKPAVLSGCVFLPRQGRKPLERQLLTSIWDRVNLGEASRNETVANKSIRFITSLFLSPLFSKTNTCAVMLWSSVESSS